jgi:hypothetical protein
MESTLKLGAYEVTLGKATIRLSNDADPVLAKQIIHSLGDFLC